jgi:hypothetical protein
VLGLLGLQQEEMHICPNDAEVPVVGYCKLGAFLKKAAKKDRKN